VQAAPRKFRSLASKFSIFTGVLVCWVVVTILCWDMRVGRNFSVAKAAMLCVVVFLVAAAISRFTMKLLARPLALLEAGITGVRLGRFDPIQVSTTGDEIEFLGENFNRMIVALAASQEEIRQHQELLEDRIRQRTEQLEIAMEGAMAASRAKSEFLANMSHELRTPMSGLLGMLDLALDGNLPQEHREHLETAQRCAYSLLALLNDILDLSKIEAGKMMLERIPFNVRTLADDCAKAYAVKAAQKGIRLTIEIDSKAPSTILGDPLRLRQIITNLLSNAVKFTEQGSVQMSVSSAGGDNDRLNLEIKVSDTGTGIPEDKLGTIFDKFTQADGSISRKYGGSGLGLAITRRLVEMQGGTVEVESKFGKGSVFTVLIPAGMVEAAPAQPSSNDGAVASERRPMARGRVLLVEDNIVNQKVVLAILQKRGYEIEVAGDGGQALLRLESCPFAYDLVLMDIQMPVLDGLEATRRIRLDGRWDALPIVAMTAHAMQGDRERCIEAGMNGYVSKPVQPAHLLGTIERLLRQDPAELAKSSTAVPQHAA